MPVLVKCQQCGKEILSPIRKGETYKYCSRTCYSEAWKGDHPELYKLPNRNCDECGREYHPKDKEHGKRFCSKTCLLAWRARQRKVNCIVCGKEFQRDNKGERFCSHECFWSWNVGDNNARFEGWLTQDKRGYIRFTVGHPEYGGQYIHSILWHEANPDGACEDCGGEVEHVHHRNDNKRDNGLSNLAGLCNSCHMKRHQPKGIKIGSK